MKKSVFIWIIVIAALAVLFIWMKNGYNNMVEAEETVENAWGQVDNQYQRRMDMIPELVSIVQGAVQGEKNTLIGVTEARAKATQVTIDPSHMTQEQLDQFQAAQGELNSALSRLLVSIEKYPDIKFNQNFVQLQQQLEGTENRIAVARNTFNDVAMGYNKLVRKFPNNILASIFGFEKKPYFKAQEGADKAVKIEWDF